MARFKTFVNGGTVLPGDVNSIEDDYEVAFGTYKVLLDHCFTIAGSSGAGTYAIGQDGAAVAGVPNDGRCVRYLDPARFWGIATTSSVNPRSVYYNLHFTFATNTPAPGINYTVGLYPVSGISAGVVTLGAAVTGSTVTLNTPALNSLLQAYSGDFAAPAAGYYALAITLSGAQSGVAVYGALRLSMRQV